jgi:ppGpp synthetase/RelA/SpoT-type nucleotidyltranferase
VSRKDVVGAIHRRQVLVVVGAGVAIDASGNRQTASWLGLLRNGLTTLQDLHIDEAWAKGELNRLGSASTDALALSFLAEQLRERMRASGNAALFDQWLKDAVDKVDAGYGKPEASKTLVSAVAGLGGRLATTNYDHILEQHTGAATLTMEQEHDVSAYIRNDLSAVLHLHGVPERPSSIVLGRESYRNYVGNKVLIEFQRALSTIYSCLFVGFGQGLEDLNFSPWFQWIRNTLAGSKIKHHVVLNNEQAKAWQSARHDGIEALGFGSQYADLPVYLAGLKEAANQLKDRSHSQSVSDPPESEARSLNERIRVKREAKENVAETFYRYIVSRLTENRLHYYAVKYRIKSFSSIWNKVKDLQKANSSGDELACVDRVRDVIGIRVVTLYRLDLRHVVRQVAGWFSCPKYTVSAPFDARLEEVRVFGNDAPFDLEQNPYEIVSGLKEHFKALDVLVTPSSRKVATSYSAFHLLCSYMADDGSRETFEIQLRSALEDIWSEMEHPLRYKPLDGEPQRASRDATELQLARYHLLSLKSLIDGAAQYADNIRTQIEHLKPVDIRTLGTYTLSKTDRLRTLLPPSPAWQRFLDHFNSNFEEETALIKNVLDPNSPAYGAENRSRSSLALIRLAADFKELTLEIDKLNITKRSDQQEAKFLVRMEQALCLLEGAARNPDTVEQEVLLKSALTIYTSIRDQIEASDAGRWVDNYKHIVWYRLARVYYRLHLIADAVEVCRIAYKRVCDWNPALPSDGDENRLKTEIANYLIFLLQDKAEDLTIQAKDLGDLNFHLQERRDLYLATAATSLESLEKIDEQNDDYCNTALFGAAEFAALGSQVWDHGVGSVALFKKLWEKFRARDISRDPDRLHTAFRVSDNVFNDKETAVRSANQLIDFIATLPEPDKYQRRDFEQAQSWLKQQQQP